MGLSEKEKFNLIKPLPEGWPKDDKGTPYLKRDVLLETSNWNETNTGRSGFFNQRGDVLQQTQYWVPDAIRATLKANSKVTFYAQHGDYLNRIAVYLTCVLLIYWIAKSLFSIGKTKKAAKTSRKKKKK